MAEPKTKATKESVHDFLNKIESQEKRKDSFEILKLMEGVTKEKPVMWGPSIVGFGLYHYKSERSSQEGDWPLIAFSPRKQSLTLYIMSGNKNSSDLLEKLGKHKTSKGCLYIKRLAEVDINILRKLIEKSFNFSKNKYK